MSNNISNDFFNPFDTTSEQISQNQVGTSDTGDADFIVSEGFARAADSVSTISATKNLDKIQIVGKDGIQVSLSSVSSTTAKFTISAPSFALGQAQLASGLTVNTGTAGRLAYYSTASSIGASSQNLTYDVNSGALSYDTANLASLINLQDSDSNKGIRFNYSSGNPSKIYADTGTLVLESQLSKITLGASSGSGIHFDNTFLTSQYGIVIENPSLWHDINSKDVSLKISAPAQSIPLAIGSSDFFVDIGSSLGDVKVGIGTNTPTHELQVIGNVSASVYYGDGSNLTGITTAPAGNNTEIQFNNAGAFGASSDFVWNDTSKQLTVNGDVSASIFYGDGSSLTNLPAPGIQNVVEDTTPQLGGNLDMNGNIVASSFEVSGAFDLHGPTAPGQESNPTWRPRVLSSNGALVLQGGQNTSTNITIAGGNITHAGNLLAYGVYNQVRLQDGNSGGRFRIFEANSGRERMEMHAFNKYTNFYVHQASPYVFRIVDGSSASDVGNDYLTISGSNQSIVMSGSSLSVTAAHLHLTGSELLFSSSQTNPVGLTLGGTNNNELTLRHGASSITVKASNVVTVSNGTLFANKGVYIDSDGSPWHTINGQKTSFRANDTTGYYIHLGSAGSPKFTVTGSSVGINTDAPTANLDVVGTFRASGSSFQVTSSLDLSGSSHSIKGDLTLIDPVTAGRSRLYFQSGGSVTPYIGTQSNQIEMNAGSYGITLKNNTTNTMRILSNRVGIALGVEPQKALEVGGEVRFGASTANIHQITGSTYFSIPDNNANAFSISGDGHEYIKIDTTDNSETITFKPNSGSSYPILTMDQGYTQLIQTVGNYLYLNGTNFRIYGSPITNHLYLNNSYWQVTGHQNGSLETTRIDQNANFYHRLTPASSSIFSIEEYDTAYNKVGNYIAVSASSDTIQFSGSSIQITGSVDATGNLTASGHVSASAFYGDGSALTNLPPGGISNVVEDTTPQLGGDLDVNGNSITGTTVVLTASSVSSDAISLRGNTEVYEDTRIRKNLTVGFVGNGNAIINLARNSNGATVGRIEQSDSYTFLDNLQGGGLKFRVAGTSLFEMMHIKNTGVDIGRIGTDISTVTGALHLDSSATNKLGGADIVNGSRVYLPRGNAILDVGNGHRVKNTGQYLQHDLRSDTGDSTFYVESRLYANDIFKITTYHQAATPPLIEMSASATQITGELEVTGNILVPLSQGGTIGFKDSAGTWNNPTRGMSTSGTNGHLYINSSYGNGGTLYLNNSFTYNYRAASHTARHRYGSPGNSYGGNSGNSYHSFWYTSGVTEYSLYIHDGGEVAVGVEASSTSGYPYFHVDLPDKFTVFGTSRIKASVGAAADTDASYASTILNSANNDNAGGLKIQAGPGTTPSKDVPILGAYNNAGTAIGALMYDNAGGAFTLYSVSDESLKENIQLSEVNCIEKIRNISLYSYDWKAGGHTDIGFVAQDLEKEVPNAVTDEEVKKISEQKLIPILTKAIQEQQEMIDKLIKRVEELENK